MNARSTSLPATVESTAAAPRPRNSHGASRPGPGRWKLALESRWQRKIDEVVILSQARSGVCEYDETATPPAVRPARKLGARIDAALDEVAAIEDALARLDDGSYGICAGCDRSMAADWLAEAPETRYCPDCSLHLVSWQPPARPKAAAARRADAAAASVDARQAAPTPAERNSRQVQQPAAVCRL